MTPEEAVEKRRALLSDWIGARCEVAAEFSSSIVGSYASIVEQAKDYAEALDVEWSDELVPAYVRDMLAWAEG